MDEKEETFDDLREFLWQIPAMRSAIATLDHVRRLCGIIDAMTPDERRNFAKIMNGSRRRRIAAGAGVELAELRQCDTFAAAMKHMARRP